MSKKTSDYYKWLRGNYILAEDEEMEKTPSVFDLNDVSVGEREIKHYEQQDDEINNTEIESEKDKAQIQSDALKLLYMSKLKKTFMILSESFSFLSDDFTGPLYRVTHNNEDREANFEENKKEAFARVIKEENYIMETYDEIVKEYGKLVDLIKEKKHEDKGEY